MEALESLSRLRSLPKEDPRVQAEWITIRAEAIHNREVLVAAHPSLQGLDWRSELKLEAASWADMFRPKLIRQTMIGIMLMFFQQFVGINAVSIDAVPLATGERFLMRTACLLLPDPLPAAGPRLRAPAHSQWRSQHRPVHSHRHCLPDSGQGRA